MMAHVLHSTELAAVVLEPHFDAVRDIFVEYEPEPGFRFVKLKKTKFVVEPEARDSDRHFARCRDDGLLIQLAPEAAELSVDQLTAVIAHEFGHAVDFAYPGCWVGPEKAGSPAIWINQRSQGTRPARRWRRMWGDRSDEQIEQTADAIVLTVTGMRVHYCGPCMVQCFSGGLEGRPEGLT